LDEKGNEVALGKGYGPKIKGVPRLMLRGNFLKKRKEVRWKEKERADLILNNSRGSPMAKAAARAVLKRRRPHGRGGGMVSFEETKKKRNIFEALKDKKKELLSPERRGTGMLAVPGANQFLKLTRGF